ncbi:hypothetical protein BD289DRAFT_450164 [Coniella lustricola]|uniref:RING-type domain-containing protein n=1 Tax=Coniella lustricola TaxID=2025994 RepID=A0A2T3AJW4_9PEZI|nr:hypothetical protein BD289DRAFT_450164 [Coniella lustricola]
MKSMRSVRTSVVRHQAEPEHVSIDPTCPICAVDIGAKSPDGVRETYAITPCGHVFGSVCIKKYLAITDKPLCPVCRIDLFHACSHPVLPSFYDPRKSRLTRDDAAAQAFPEDLEYTDCNYCRHRKLKYARRLRRQEILETAARKGSNAVVAPATATASATASSSTSATAGGSASGSGSSEGGGSDDSEHPEHSPSRATRALRLAVQTIHITVALARLTLDATRIRKIKTHIEDAGSDTGDSPEEGDSEGDIVSPGSPSLAANPSMPPVPGLYGHWDLANKGPDWKFLGWYDQQEPKTKTRPEHFTA